MPTYRFPRPALTVDIVVVAGPEDDRRVLLIRRGEDPFGGMWALPGGFVDENEPLESAARRELAEETGLSFDRSLVQIGAFGDPGRDPRGWTVSVVFGTVLGAALPGVKGADDAAEAEWHALGALPPLAFDHDAVLAAAERRLLGDPAG
jgi:8-oxo-dGTP diphosphatase